MDHSEIVKKHRGTLQSFAQHGVTFIKEAGNNAVGVCPICSKSKMYVNVENRLWDCKVCGIEGNFDDFLHAMNQHNLRRTTLKTLANLAKHRGLSALTLKEFGVGKNNDGEYTFPTYLVNKQGATFLSDLPRYNPEKKKSYGTTGAKVGLIMPKKTTGSDTVWVCEGEWDCMAWYEVLRKCKIEDDVYGVRGASNFPKSMPEMFTGKHVIMLYDNDTPGQAGMSRTWQMLAPYAKSIQRVEWPPTDNLPDGFDVRDLYHTVGSNGKKALASVRKMLTSEPDVTQAATGGAKLKTPDGPSGDDTPDPNGKGMLRAKVIKAYQKWLHLPNTEMIDVLYGSVFANRMKTDPLWIYFVTSPSGGKSEFLMSLAISPWICCVSTLTPKALISGMQTPGGDPSLFAKIMRTETDYTLVVKDYTTVLKMNQVARDDVLSLLRDAYDGQTTKVFGNMTRSYEGNFGIIAGVTQEIDNPTISDTSLGERFLKYRMRHHGKITAGKHMIMRTLSNIGVEGDMRSELKDVARQVLDRPISRPYPTRPKEIDERIMGLAQWVARMRGSVSRSRYHRDTVTHKPVSEIGGRLAKQLAILGMGIAMFRGEDEVSEDVYNILVKIARDTAPDKAEEVIKQMYTRRPEEEASTEEISTWCPSLTPETVKFVLQDLRMLGIVVGSGSYKGKWRISDPVLSTMDKLGLYTMELNWRDGVEQRRKDTRKKAASTVKKRVIKKRKVK